MLRRLLVLIFLAVAISGSWLLARAQDDNGKPAAQSQRDDSRDSARETEISSSKDTRIDLSPPKDDAKNHPDSIAVITDEETPSDVDEMHPWDPHKAAKDIEVGDYYFKRKNYRGALERYKDALIYKPSDAVANFRLAECEEKVGNSSDAVEHYQAYLKILPNGPFAVDARKALDRLKSPTSSLR
jgi:tetratricopeptide (TPR) repeat protein